MNVKNKIVALAMSFVICFGTVFNSFCNDKEYIIDNKNGRSVLTLGGLVITKEVFNVIVGVAGACGVALLTYDDKFSFVDEFLSYYSDLKVDSGEFTTSPVEDFEEEIKKHVKRPSNNNSGGDNNNLIVGSSLITLICSIFDNMFKDKPDKYYIYENSVPTANKYFSLKEQNLILNDEQIVSINLPGSDSIDFKYNKGMNDFKWRLNSVNNQDTYTGYRNSVFKKECNDSKCSNYGKSGYYHIYISRDSYSNVISNGQLILAYPNLNNNDYTSFAPCYYFGGQVDKTNYRPILKDTTISNDDVVGSYPGINVNGSLDIPPGAVTPPGDSNVDFELPPVPGFDDEGIDLSFLTDLFEHLKGKFPFSIPFDLYNLIDVLRTEPIAPKFDFKFLDNEISLDLTQFEDWANIVRAFSVFSWVFVLFTFTKKLGG